MCTPFVRKEANRFNWIVKGCLCPKHYSDNDIENTYNSYFRRLWYNDEAQTHSVGFEQAYKCREAELLNESKSHPMGLVQKGTSILGRSYTESEAELLHVAVLGYD